MAGAGRVVVAHLGSGGAGEQQRQPREPEGDRPGQSRLLLGLADLLADPLVGPYVLGQRGEDGQGHVGAVAVGLDQHPDGLVAHRLGQLLPHPDQGGRRARYPGPRLVVGERLAQGPRPRDGEVHGGAVHRQAAAEGAQHMQDAVGPRLGDGVEASLAALGVPSRGAKPAAMAGTRPMASAPLTAHASAMAAMPLSPEMAANCAGVTDSPAWASHAWRERRLRRRPPRLNRSRWPPRQPTSMNTHTPAASAPSSLMAEHRRARRAGRPRPGAAARGHRPPVPAVRAWSTAWGCRGRPGARRWGRR